MGSKGKRDKKGGFGNSEYNGHGCTQNGFAGKIRNFEADDNGNATLNRLPKLVPLICVVQVLIHYLKTPNREILIFQFDPLRRFEVWRFLTPFLIHSGNGDGVEPFDAHLWSNIFGGLLFGWKLETIVKWRWTAIIYMSSLLSASLLSSAWKPCGFSVGSSDAFCGLMLVNFLGHFLMPKVSGNWWWKLAGVSAVLTFTEQYYLTYFLPNYDPSESDYVAHIGGAVGGAMSFLILVLSSSYSQTTNEQILRLKKACYLFTVTFCIVTVACNLTYAHILSYIHFNRDLVRDTLSTSAIYEDFATKQCHIFWTWKKVIWQKCPIARNSALAHAFDDYL